MFFDRLKLALTSPFAIKLAITLGVLVIIVILLDAVVLPSYTHSGAIVDVPPVTGKSFEEATGILESSGLTAMKGFEQFDEKTAAGTVLSQNPPANRKVKAGRHVYLAVNSGERPMSPLPDLKGRSFEDAKLALERLKFKVGAVEYAVTADGDRDGAVVMQSPPKGTLLKLGSLVSLTVGRSSAQSLAGQSAVPDVTGKTFAEAQRLLIEAGFTLGKTKMQYTEKLIPKTVIDQLPKAGELAPLGKPVDLSVATANRADEQTQEPPVDPKPEGD
ncbi:MAG: PASTA domain-containing protein [Rhizobacter sp.]|nr:PASTA domain-containing protein [Chlorobiales bacterium]